MKKVININFQGRIIPIEESAYDILRQYVDSLRKFFANEEGSDEIINDIEGRIAELFGETLKKGVTCITDDDVTRIIDSMGRPEDFDDDEARLKSQLGNEQKGPEPATADTSAAYASAEPRRLYRDENHKVLGGVCSGLANYFGIDPVIVRVLFLVGFFGFGIAFIPYIILWIAVPSTASTAIGSQRKRLFRDPDDKIIAGVCSGLAQYFGLNVWIPRLFFLIPFFTFIFRIGRWNIWDFNHFLSVSFSPGAIFVYTIMWMVLPEARSTADKLQMKGEKVDLNNIKNTIQGDMEGFKERAQQYFETEVKPKAEQFGQEFSSTVRQRGRQFSTEATSVARRGGRGLGDIIALFARIFAYFILGCVLFGLVAGLFALGVLFTGLLPAKEFILNNGWENIFAWGTLLLFIWVPVVGIVTLVIRRIARMRGNSRLIRSTFLALWLLGLLSFIGLLASLRNDFRYVNHHDEQNITLANPKVNKLELRLPSDGRYYGSHWFKIEPFTSFDDDTVFVQNMSVRVVKAIGDSFVLTVVKTAYGRTRKEADDQASRISYNVSQQDSVLLLDKGIAITANEKFRNQHILLTIAVPVGKHIKIHENIGWDHDIHVGFFDGDADWRNFDRDGEHWTHNVDYIQTENDGLQRADHRVDADEIDNTIQELKKNREEILRQKQQKIKELQDIDHELQQPLPADSTRYHYQPEKSKRAAKAVTAETQLMICNTSFLKFYI